MFFQKYFIWTLLWVFVNLAQIDLKVREFASKDKLVIGGSGCEGTSLTIDMSNKMAAAGADAVMVLTPCYFKGNMDVNALVGHYKAVADACSVPVFLYNIPMATG